MEIYHFFMDYWDRISVLVIHHVLILPTRLDLLQEKLNPSLSLSEPPAIQIPSAPILHAVVIVAG